MYLKRQTFLVLGLSKSGCAAVDFLSKHQAVTYIYDDMSGERMEQTIKGLEEKGAKRVKKEDLARMSEVCDVLVLSPGIPIDHPVAVAFKRNRKAVIGETELAVRCMRCPIVAITGTNGKTTTVTMLAEVLNKGGVKAVSCGNIGTPMIEYTHLTDEVAVTEISSFQLETLQSLRPHVAIVLNVTEDHLNRHYNMDNYIFLKRKLLKNCVESEYAVLNYDDPIVRSFAEKTRAQVLYFSVKERVVGAYYEDGNLYFGKEKILSASDLPIGGLHNVQNALAVIAAAKIMGISNVDIISALTDFKGVKHRMETLNEVNGVTFIDDSKGTNVDATLKAIESLKKESVLLLGGKNKGYNYDKLFATLSGSKIIHAILYGENRFALLKSAYENHFTSITLCDKFDFAVRIAALKAKPGQAVLLSPASASFDEFANYEERGEKFAEIVQDLLPKTNEYEEDAEGDADVE